MPTPRMKEILNTPRFLNVREAAAMLKVTPDYLYDLIDKKRGPPVIRFGRLMRIRTEDFDAWINSHLSSNPGM
jgi:excisionase family DNA binding protein